MAYVPKIQNYKPFYIQVEGTCHDTLEWGMVAKSNPLPLLPAPKEPYSNDWAGEDGLEEYTDVMHYSHVDFSVGFYVKCYATAALGAEEVLRGQIRDFFALVRAGEFMTYDSYTGTGFKAVRYAGYSEESFLARKDWARAVFTVNFRADDPVTVVRYDNGTLVEA